MMQRPIADIAAEYGLTIEPTPIHEHANAYRIYKGARHIFIGTEEAVREFLQRYEIERPGPREDKLRGYKE